MDLKTD